MRAVKSAVVLASGLPPALGLTALTSDLEPGAVGWLAPDSIMGISFVFAVPRVAWVTGLWAIPRRANTGTFTKSKMNAKMAAAARVAATSETGKCVIAIPPTANVEAIAISATDDPASKRLGREPHKCRRSRMA